MFHKILFLSVCLVAFAFILPAPSAHAANQVVTNCSNDDELRTKLAAMQGAGGGGTLTFNCGKVTIILDSGSPLPLINTDTTIDGGKKITLSGGNSTRVLNVANGGDLTLSNLTIINGFSTGDGGAITVAGGGELTVEKSKFLENQTSAGSGGAIVTYGPLDIRDSEFARNKGANGGALYVRYQPAPMSIYNTKIHDNETTSTVDGWGGAILLWDGADTDIYNSDLYNNKARKGGAIHNQFANSSVVLQETKIRNNTAEMEGGGIYNANGGATFNRIVLSGNKSVHGAGAYNSVGELVFVQSEISKNEAGGDGGGVHSYGGDTNLVNVTVSGNKAFDQGGGVYTSKGSMAIVNSTFVGNKGSAGGALYHYGTVGTTVSLKNSILADSPSGGNCYEEPASAELLISGGFNLSTDNSCSAVFVLAGDQNNKNAKLGPLALNGGPTQTHKPNTGSPALNKATNIGGGIPTDDQRGFSRPQGSANDIGAVEVCTVAPAKPVLQLPANNSNIIGKKTILKWNYTNCAESYNVVLRVGSQSGAIVLSKTNLPNNSAKTPKLTKGTTYYWQVTGVNAKGTKASAWFKFKIQ